MCLFVYTFTFFCVYSGSMFFLLLVLNSFEWASGEHQISCMWLVCGFACMSLEHEACFCWWLLPFSTCTGILVHIFVGNDPLLITVSPNICYVPKYLLLQLWHTVFDNYFSDRCGDENIMVTFLFKMKKTRRKSWPHHFLKYFHKFITPSFITEIREECRRQPWKPDSTVWLQ